MKTLLVSTLLVAASLHAQTAQLPDTAAHAQTCTKPVIYISSSPMGAAPAVCPKADYSSIYMLYCTTSTKCEPVKLYLQEPVKDTALGVLITGAGPSQPGVAYSINIDQQYLPLMTPLPVASCGTVPPVTLPAQLTAPNIVLGQSGTIPYMVTYLDGNGVMQAVGVPAQTTPPVVTPPSTPSIVKVSTNTAAMNFGAGTVALTPIAGNTVIVEFYEQTGSAVTVTDNTGVKLVEAKGSPQPLAPVFGGFLHEFSYIAPAGVTGLSFSFSGSFAEAIVHEATGLPSPQMIEASGDAYAYGNLDPQPTLTTPAPLSIGVFFSGGPLKAGDGWTLGWSVSTADVVMTTEWSAGASAAAIHATYAPDAFINSW